ncbi:MAG TPA: M48 family metallopeptidase [Saprospiraceae bacterium]|nr:M48 family metallopeptidase [Saprospiraceae bacterium]
MNSLNKVALLVGGLLFINGCSTLKKTWNEANVFPVSQDVELGKQVYDEILSNPTEYPIVPEAGNEELYSYVRGIVKKILNTGKVNYSTQFAWKVSLVNNEKIQNAFATPGGYIFVYTGLMKFLDSEDQLAGVLAHEIAHAAQRHSTRQLTKILGVQALADAAFGKKETIKQVATAVVGLQFSRDHETEADSFSVKYLCPTSYNAAGAAGFFKKIAGQPTPPQWLSTHPNPSNRIKNIENKSIALQCSGKDTYQTRYTQIKALITKIPPPTIPQGSQLPKNTNANQGKDSSGKPAPTGNQSGTGAAPGTKLEKKKPN